jgi:hypothetical protein
MRGSRSLNTLERMGQGYQFAGEEWLRGLQTRRSAEKST